MFNLLDVPALCFPVTKVDPSVDQPDPNFKALDEEDQRFHDECAFPRAVSSTSAPR